jgi:protoporphyrinogen oxidase
LREGKVIILGAGVTGLAAGLASGLPLYELTEVPGGICASYYLVPGEQTRLYTCPRDGEAYRFEIGGGHWLWGGDALILRFLRSMTAFKSYPRNAAVYLPNQTLTIPYPIQNHLSCLGPEVGMQVLSEMLEANQDHRPMATLAEWMHKCFGPTLCKLFFDPFHELYTAGLWRKIVPQDELKSPVSLSLVVRGAVNHTALAAGYNVNFFYPVEGLNVLAQRMAQQCEIHYCKQVVQIDVEERTVVFSDGTVVPYKALLCTLPLNATLKMTGLRVSSPSDPSTSVLVVNVGARKGPRCPGEHWLYIPQSNAGFHRVGFYSNVDSSFLPVSIRNTVDHASIYVEKAYLGGQRLSEAERRTQADEVVKELQAWGWIEEVEVLDPTWIATAYTWQWPGSQWRRETISTLESHGIYQLGRYGRWAHQLADQGIAQSIRDGLWAGASFKQWT